MTPVGHRGGCPNARARLRESQRHYRCEPNLNYGRLLTPVHMQGGAVASGGLRELIPTVARTAVAAGVDGIFMEVLTQFISTPSETWQFGRFLRHACMNSNNIEQQCYGGIY